MYFSKDFSFFGLFGNASLDFVKSLSTLSLENNAEAITETFPLAAKNT